MAKRSSTSLHWLTLAVVIPLVVLVAMAWIGLREQSRTVWDEKQKEAERVAEAAAEAVAKWFTSKVTEFEIYPDPPVPGSTSPADKILDGKDVSALIALRDSPDAGLSPAGLPRRVLAALRLVALDPERLAREPGEIETLARLATVECPSILTGMILEKLHPESGSAVETWEQQRVLTQLLREHPGGGWIQRGSDYWWIESSGTKIRYVAPWNFTREGLAQGWLFIFPTGLSSRLSMDTNLPRSNGEPVVFAAAPIPFGKGLRLEVFLTSPELVVESIRRQERWTFSLLALAVAVSAVGLFLIHRTLRRERLLNEMKSQFVASVSHELRAPVASIRLMADALEAEKVAPETAKEFHRLIAREGARLSTLVGNVLDHARIEQGRRVWKMETCDLESLVADTLRVMEPLAQEKNIALRSALSPVEAAVDAGAIQQALVNLLDNAIKFSPAGSTVETALSCDDGSRTWRLAVKDDGPGIAKAEQVRIFERFYRPGDELRRETQGTGIGLSLVKSIAEAHDGSVSVESEPGHGSTFTLNLPLSK